MEKKVKEKGCQKEIRESEVSFKCLKHRRENAAFVIIEQKSTKEQIEMQYFITSYWFYLMCRLDDARFHTRNKKEQRKIKRTKKK